MKHKTQVSIVRLSELIAVHILIIGETTVRWHAISVLQNIHEIPDESQNSWSTPRKIHVSLWK